MGDELEEDPLEPAAVLWDIPISIARVDVESVADVFDPKNKKKQEQLLDHVSLWSQNLSASLSELLAWKDDCFELKALPLNMLSQLAIIMSRLVREKGEMIPPLHQALDINVPIGCGDAPVFPGDVIVGDAEGVVVIPAHIADEIAAEAVEMTAFEDFVTEKVQEGRSILGLYPPTDEQSRVDFAAWRAQRGR